MMDVRRCEADYDNPVRQHHCHRVKKRRYCQEHGKDVVLGRFPSSVADVGPVEAAWMRKRKRKVTHTAEAGGATGLKLRSALPSVRLCCQTECLAGIMLESL